MQLQVKRILAIVKRILSPKEKTERSASYKRVSGAHLSLLVHRIVVIRSFLSLTGEVVSLQKKKESSSFFGNLEAPSSPHSRGQTLKGKASTVEESLEPLAHIGWLIHSWWFVSPSVCLPSCVSFVWPHVSHPCMHSLINCIPTHTRSLSFWCRFVVFLFSCCCCIEVLNKNNTRDSRAGEIYQYYRDNVFLPLPIPVYYTSTFLLHSDSCVISSLQEKRDCHVRVVCCACMSHKFSISTGESEMPDIRIRNQTRNPFSSQPSALPYPSWQVALAETCE